MAELGSVHTPLSPEMLVPRLGDALVQKGHISEAQLAQALEKQQKMQAVRNPYLLGEALMELGFINRAILDDAITEQIIQLRTALEDANRNLEARVRARTIELQEALRKLSELNQMKANFISNVSHELRTPLTHIKGYLELLGASALGPMTQEQQDAVDVSRKATGRLESLVDNLILFSHAARGEMTLKLMPLWLEETLGEVIEFSRPKAADRGIALQVEFERGLPEVKADPEKLTWVVLQLLDNAIKFTPSGGRVSLQARRESEKMVMLTVSDTGIGIPEDRRAELFEPFHQLDASASRRYGGTGMGLALVRQILEAHGSMIEIESLPNQGATFRFPLLTVERGSDGRA